ncbi:MAG: type IV secretory system conjugative DNA transfer family protein [Cyanobacteria bacterium J06631_2]
MMHFTQTLATIDAPRQPNPLDPLLKPLLSPTGIGFGVLFMLLLVAKNFQGRSTVLSDGRFVSGREIAQAEKLGRKQIAEGVHNKAALKLDRIILPDLQPAISIVGRSRGGKTRSVIDPGIKSSIEQGWTNLVLDVKGNLMRKHAAFAYANGYDVYRYAPGQDSDGLNFLKFMENGADAMSAEQIATTLEANFGEPGAKKDNFFSPQGVALLKLVFMLAKSSPFPDLLSAWKFLSLPDLAGRLEAAHQFEQFRDIEHGNWIAEAAVALRSVGKSQDTVSGIVGSAVTNFQRMVDRSILPCLINHSIPLDLPGKQIVFFQIDEQNEAATAPLVATALSMLVNRNLNANVRRKNTLGLWLDEFDSLSLPDIKNWVNRSGEYGLVASLSYQSDSQVKLRYSRDYLDAVISSCGTKVVFNTGHPETADKLSHLIGKKEITYQSESRSYGVSQTRNTSEHKQTVPLIEGSEINRFAPGECVILSPGYQFRPRKLKIPIDKKNDRLWKRSENIWDNQILPHRLEQAEARTEDPEISLVNRQIIAESTLPTAAELQTAATEEIDLTKQS